MIENYVKRILERNLDTIITHSEMTNILDMPQKHTIEFATDLIVWQLERMYKLKEVQKWLLREHFHDLQNVHGVGYKVIPAPEQTRVAVADYQKTLDKAFRQTKDRLDYVDLEKLTPDERRENTDALCALAKARSFAQAEFDRHRPRRKTGRTVAALDEAHPD